MTKKSKVIVILPAYNAEKSLLKFVNGLPKRIFDETILVDDCSGDGTYAQAKKLKGITVYRTPRNLGYGGNLKMCLTLALSHGADVIVELHPDGEYDTDGIVPSLQEVERGSHLVLGNRFAHRQKRIPQGMLFSKYLITRLLSRIDNVVLGSRIPDLHQGFRVYTRTLLQEINWRSTSDDFLFSFEIISQAVFGGFTIAYVPVTARYSGRKRGATWGHSLRYTLGTWKVLAKYLMAKAGIGQRLFAKLPKEAICPICQTPALVEKYWQRGAYGVYRCHICRNGFIWPFPSHIEQFYTPIYYQLPGLLGNLKNAVFSWAQKRRSNWLKQYYQQGDVLDVGSGSGRFGRTLGSTFRVINMDPYYEGNTASVIKQDFLTWKTSKRFDAITFWESLEHTPDPAVYLRRAVDLLKPRGTIFIEYPRWWDSLEAKLFGKYWFHLDVPRHLFHFTDSGMKHLLAQEGFTVIRHTGVLAFDYAPWGFAQSLASWVIGQAPFLERRDVSLWRLLLLLPFLLIGEVCEVGLFLFGQSPIGLVVACKEKA